MKIGNSIQMIRKENNLSQEEFGKLFHVTRQTISNWENEKSYPDLQTLIAISEHFEISLDKLLKEDAVLVQKIDISNKRANYLTLVLMGFLPFLFGRIIMYVYTYFPTSIAFLGLIILVLWGRLCYKTVHTDRNFYLQIGLLNIGGLISFVLNILYQFELINPTPYFIWYIYPALFYPMILHIFLVNRHIILPFIWVNIAASIIMFGIIVIAALLKRNGYKFLLTFKIKKQN